MADLSHLIVYMTAQSPEEAQRIAAALVEKRLAACCNVLGAINAVFWWEGAVQKEGETAFIAKTTAARFDSLCDAVRELHSYETPCIVALPIIGGDPEFLSWIDEMTALTQ